MPNVALPDPAARAMFRATLATLLLTSAHHIYGGLRYHTDWRLHGAAVALVLAGVLFGALKAYERAHDGRARRLPAAALLFVALVAVLAIGLFEGAYNHAVKNALFFAGASMSLMTRMFPPPTYELPNDAWFEVSGVAQVLPAAFAAVALARFVREQIPASLGPIIARSRRGEGS